MDENEFRRMVLKPLLDGFNMKPETRRKRSSIHKFIYDEFKDESLAVLNAAVRLCIYELPFPPNAAEFAERVNRQKQSFTTIDNSCADEQIAQWDKHDRLLEEDEEYRADIEEGQARLSEYVEELNRGSSQSDSKMAKRGIELMQKKNNDWTAAGEPDFNTPEYKEFDEKWEKENITS